MVGIQYLEIGILIYEFPHVFYSPSIGASLFSSKGRLLGFLYTRIPIYSESGIA